LDESQLVTVDDLNCHLLPDAATALLQLCEHATNHGFHIKVASSFRSFERQLLIWNAKAAGQRPVMDSEGLPLDMDSLSELEKIEAIMRWSALPGASRHHWGTDLDVYDTSLIDADYRVQLTLGECFGSGPFALFHQWLDASIADGNSFGFYRPYAIDRGGVAPEPWHLSFAPLSQEFAVQHNETLLRQLLEQSDIAFKPTILEHLPALYQRFVQLPK
jgi:LAS superfamily LD-carboxypeptidase LdcB